MNIAWGIVLILISGLAYIGQLISLAWPMAAVKLGLTESEADVDPAFFADLRGEAAWDAATLWTLPVAGVLMVIDHNLWIPFALVGGGTYLYFAGRGIVVRLVMKNRSIRIGSRRSVGEALLFLAIWGISAIVTIILAIRAIPTL